MTAEQKKQLKTAAQWVVAFALVGVLIWKVNWSEVWQALVHVRVGYVAAFVVLYIVGIVISARKWQDLATIALFRHRFLFYFRAYFVGIFINHFLPSFIGGDTYRVYALGRAQRRMADATATVVWDRVSGLVAFVVLAFMGLLLQGSMALTHPILRVMTAGTTVGLCVLVGGILLLRNEDAAQLAAYVPRRIATFARSYKKLFTKRTVVAAGGWSMAFSLVSVGLANLMLFYAFSVDLALRDYMSVIFLTNILAALPISVGNIGVKEWAYIVLFGIFGVGSSVLVAIVMLSRVLQMLVSLAAVPFYMRHRGDIPHKADAVTHSVRI